MHCIAYVLLIYTEGKEDMMMMGSIRPIRLERILLEFVDGRTVKQVSVVWEKVEADGVGV
jgi:hypothetical protein